MMFLLDVNALLAMRYAEHVHYGRVHLWASQLAAERGRDHIVFATCPITELGFVRVGSGKAGYAASVEIARDDLQDVKISSATGPGLEVITPCDASFTTTVLREPARAVAACRASNHWIERVE